MDLTASDFKNQLQALLPKGPAWESDTPVLLDAWSQELARVQARAQGLITEADPRSTYELLRDYELLFGLPSACMTLVGQSTDQRRMALVSKMISVGGQSRAYLIAWALAAGYVVTITEFIVFDVGMTVADPINGRIGGMHSRLMRRPSLKPFSVLAEVLTKR